MSELLADLGRGVGDDELLDVLLLGLVPYGLGFRNPERVRLLLGLREPDDGVLQADVRRRNVADRLLHGPARRLLDYLLRLLATATATTAAAAAAACDADVPGRFGDPSDGHLPAAAASAAATAA